MKSAKKPIEKYIYVIDTSVVQCDHLFIDKFKNHDIVIPIAVIQDLDRLKNDTTNEGIEINSFLIYLDKISEGNTLQDWINIGKRAKGKIKLEMHEDSRIDSEKIFGERSSDHKILNTALYVSEKYPNRKVIVISNKMTLRVKAKSLSLNSIDFKFSQKNTQQSNSGGYIIMDLPDNKKSLFSDLLRGFVDFAKLKGYSIEFSHDNTISNKIAFKFTLMNGEKNINEKNIRNDIREYIDKIRSGENFDDVPIVISSEEHYLILTALQNRTKFLQANYNLEKNSGMIQENLSKQFSSAPNWLGHHPTILINAGGVHTSKSLIANNSSNILQGEDVSFEDNSDHSSITISNSFNKKKEQLVKLDELLNFLKQEKGINEDQKQHLITNFHKIKEEIEDEEKPDKHRIYKWLSNTKKVVEAVVFSKDISETIEWIYKNFNFIIGKH